MYNIASSKTHNMKLSKTMLMILVINGIAWSCKPQTASRKSIDTARDDQNQHKLELADTVYRYTNQQGEELSKPMFWFPITQIEFKKVMHLIDIQKWKLISYNSTKLYKIPTNTRYQTFIINDYVNCINIIVCYEKLERWPKKKYTYQLGFVSMKTTSCLSREDSVSVRHCFEILLTSAK